MHQLQHRVNGLDQAVRSTQVYTESSFPETQMALHLPKLRRINIRVANATAEAAIVMHEQREVYAEKTRAGTQAEHCLLCFTLNL